MKVPDVEFDPFDVERALAPNFDVVLSDKHPAALDPEHWSIGPCVLTRDSGLRAQANYNSLIKHLKTDCPNLRKDWQSHTFDHWGFGWAEHLSFRVLNKDGTPSAIFKVLKAWDNALSDYPVADDSELSRLEHDAGVENIRSEGYRYLREGVEDGWEAAVFSWLWENDQEACSDVDDRGPYPSGESVKAAMKALGFTEEEENEDL